VVGVGNNTDARFVRVGHDDPQKIEIRLHDNVIGYLYDDNATQLFDGGWDSLTTTRRLDWMLLPLGYRIRKVGRTWKVYSIETGQYRDFHNGMVVRKGEF
jgi:hypothetical protein